MTMLSVYAFNERLYARRAAAQLGQVDEAAEAALREIEEALNKLSAVVDRTQVSGITEPELRECLHSIRDHVDEMLAPTRMDLDRRAQG